MNRNLYTGGSQVDEVMGARDEKDQAWDSTSDIARGASDLTGNTLTPIQVDQFLQQFGNFGKGLRAAGSEDKNPLSEMFNFAKAFTPADSVDDDKLKTRSYFKDKDDVYNTYAKNGADENTLRAFQAIHGKREGDNKENMLNSATKAMQYMGIS